MRQAGRLSAHFAPEELIGLAVDRRGHRRSHIRSLPIDAGIERPKLRTTDSIPRHDDAAIE
jgi:hypothetical protein